MRPQQLWFATPAPPGSADTTWYTAGWLTIPEKLRSPELQILVHGAGGDHRYWAWPTEPARYSYVDWAAAHGIATLAIDRVGAGFSSRPPGRENTIEHQAAALHELVSAARDGRFGPEFDRVVLVGHSLGSVVCGVEAATYADVDATVLTGYMPVDAPDEALTEEFFDAVFEPAADRLPHLRGLIDDDYLMAKPIDTSSMLFCLDNADPAIVEAQRDFDGALTRGELAATSTAGPLIRSSNTSTLVLVGQFDGLLIDASTDRDCHDAARRLADVSPSTFTYRVVDNAGHLLTLQFNAAETFELMNDWIGEQLDRN
jgi:pimeloyl-ACP methyl ester carboxylesterase